MKEKRTKRLAPEGAIRVFLLVTAVFVLSGCGTGSISTGEMPLLENTPVPITGTPETDTAPEQTAKAKKKKEEKKKEKKEEKKFSPMEITKGDLGANMKEALKHVTICGKKLSFPFTLDDMGKEFTFEEYRYVTQTGKDSQGDLYYNGRRIADITIQGGREKGDIRKKSIYHIHFCTFTDNTIEFDICGVNLDTPMEHVADIWGEGDNAGNENEKGRMEYWEDGKDVKDKNRVVVMGTLEGEVINIDVLYRRKKK